MDYAFEHQGKAYTPNGDIDLSNVAEHNKQQETIEIEWLKTAPDKVFLYVQDHTESAAITTWLGTVVSTQCEMLPRVYTGFGGSFRRPIRK